MQFALILALQVTIMTLATIKLMFVRSEEGKRVDLINTIQEASISLFVLLIVLLKNKNDFVQYLMVIALSVSIIAEIIIIVLEVIKDVVEVFVTFLRKKTNRVRQQKEGGQTPITSVQGSSDQEKVVMKESPRNLKINCRGQGKGKKNQDPKVKKKQKKQREKNFKSTKAVQNKKGISNEIPNKRRKIKFPSRRMRFRGNPNKKSSKFKAHLKKRFGGDGRARRINISIPSQRPKGLREREEDHHIKLNNSDENSME